MESSCGLALCGWVGVPEDSPERILVEVQPPVAEDPGMLEMPVHWSDHQEQQNQRILQSARVQKTSCVCCRRQSQRSDPSPLEELSIV